MALPNGAARRLTPARKDAFVWAFAALLACALVVSLGASAFGSGRWPWVVVALAFIGIPALILLRWAFTRRQARSALDELRIRHARGQISQEDLSGIEEEIRSTHRRNP